MQTVEIEERMHALEEQKDKQFPVTEIVALMFWPATVWAVLGGWLLMVLPFPLNIGLLAWQCLFGLVASWLIVLYGRGIRVDGMISSIEAGKKNEGGD